MKENKPKFAIEAKNLVKVFKDKRAVDGVSFAIKEGEIYGFLGPNGAGKSTTIRMLVTLAEPTSGDAQILGSSVTNAEGEVRLKIGAALQEAALDESQKGMEFLKLQGQLYGLRGKLLNERLSELATLVDIGPAIHQPIKTYSGGMKRRLDLAAALIHEPKVLFLDEPTTGLDPISRSRIWDEIRRLNKDEGMTIFLTTQYLEEADKLCDRVAIIADGKLRAEGSPKELKKMIGGDIVTLKLSKPGKDAAVVLGKVKNVRNVSVDDNVFSVDMVNASAHIADLVAATNKCSSGIVEMSVRTPSLDDVFLKVTGTHLKNEDAEGAQ